MPLRDGTGPFGLEPGSERGRGRYCAGFGYKRVSRSLLCEKQGWLLGLAVPFTVAAIHKLFKPSGLLYRIIYTLSNAKVTENAQKNKL